MEKLRNESASGQERLSQQGTNETPPVSGLLNAALAGLLGTTLGACGTTKTETVDLPDAPPMVTKTSRVEMTLASFTAECQKRGGLVQTHASCAGNNSCKGMSFNEGTLIEHTCRGANTCTGMSCVDLPEDKGLTGAEILTGQKGASVKCTFCHGSSIETFKLPIAPGVDASAAQTAFAQKSNLELVNIIAFGLHGINADGSAYANMPGFYKDYSRAEIERVVSQIRTLKIEAKVWQNSH